MFSNTVLFGLAAVLGGLIGYAGWQYYHQDTFTLPTTATNAAPAETPNTVTPPAAAAPVSTPATPAQMQKLRGKWVRTDSDGAYVLDIKNFAEDGKLDATYQNPRPINVAKAEATTADGQLRIFVELRDLNYPGSTYDLRYDAASDKLVGEYFQATQQQRFQVDFDRAK